MEPEPRVAADEVDEQFRSFMEGLRTTLPGVQVLFAFLLVLPFQGSFADITGLEQRVYYTAFLTAALATVLLIAPSVHQRVRANRTTVARRHPGHLRSAVHIANVGTVLAVVALAASAYLVSSIVFGNLLAVTASVVVAAAAGYSWFYLPMVSWNRSEESTV